MHAGIRKRLPLLLLLLFLASPAGSAQELTLDYLYRYNCQSYEPDHLLDVLAVSGGRAIIAGNRGLALVDLSALTVQGTQNHLCRLLGLNARNIYTEDGEFFYVNLNRGESGGSSGSAVFRMIGNDLQYIMTLDEPDVIYEKMCVSNGYLYVAAHSHGLRIFDVSNPSSPTLVGSLEQGFVDAFAVAVDGDTAYVADGGAGLKIVDVTDRQNPFIIDGESLATAAGTSEDVTFGKGMVYVAAGGAGINVYVNGEIDRRREYPVGGCAKDLCWVGELLVAATIHGIVALEPDGKGGLIEKARESTARRGLNGTLRLCNGVGSASGDRILCADWNYMDVYQLVPEAVGTQADITGSVQRIRFPPQGGDREVTLFNHGAIPLDISKVEASVGSFSTNYAGGVIPPGDAISFLISYNGGAAGTGVVRFLSNDPDESPLPIQVFGKTSYLDPGEPAVDFTLPELRKDPVTGAWIEEPFTLSDHLGKVVWFQVYASW